MTTKKDRDFDLATLRKLLAEAEERASKAESRLVEQTERVKALEAENQLLKTKVQVAEALSPYFQRLHAEVVAYLAKECEDDPRILIEKLTNFALKMKDEAAIARDVIAESILRYFSKGGESLKTAKKGNRKAEKESDKASRDLNTRANRMQQAINTVRTAVEQTAQESAEAESDTALRHARNILESDMPPNVVPDSSQLLGRRSVSADEAESSVGADEESQNVYCPKCGHEEMNAVFVSEEQIRSMKEVINNLAAVKTYDSTVYHCPHCQSFHEPLPPNVPAPVSPQSEYSQPLINTIEYGLWLGVPVNRMATLLGLRQKHFSVSRINALVVQSVLTIQQPLYDAIEAQARLAKTVSFDETQITILQQSGRGVCKPLKKKNSSQAYFFNVASMPQVATPFAVFYHLDGRSTEAIKAVAENLKAEYFVTDGYAVYDSDAIEAVLPENAQHQTCLCHVRRKFLNALDDKFLGDALRGEAGVATAKEGLKNGSPEIFFCLLIEGYRKLYTIESYIQSQEFESEEERIKETLSIRQRYSAPLLDDMDGLVQGMAERFAERTGSGWVSKERTPQAQAIVYYLNQSPKMRTYLTNADMLPDSNGSERAIRRTRLSEATSFFRQSVETGKALAQLFTILETARMNGITDPLTWLNEYGRAWYQYSLDATWNHDMQELGDVRGRRRKFCKDSDAGFDVTPWLPWNYVKAAK